jgi:hypothetical protein
MGKQTAKGLFVAKALHFSLDCMMRIQSHCIMHEQYICPMIMQALVPLTFSFMEWCNCKIYVYSNTRFLYSSLDFGYYVHMWQVDRHTDSSKYLH